MKTPNPKAAMSKAVKAEGSVKKTETAKVTTGKKYDPSHRLGKWLWPKKKK